MPDQIAEIIDCGVDIVIRAGAGTGKTRALVSKYMAEITLKRDEGYAGVDRLAAITFTEKAATEMSERVRVELSKLIEKLRAEEVLKGSSANLEADDPEWSEKARLLNHLLRQRQMLKSAYISTIHSFCARLLWENPITAGVDPAFKVMDEVEAQSLLEKTIRDVILRKLRNGDEGVRRLVRDYGFSSKGHVKGLKEYALSMIPLFRAANLTAASLGKISVQQTAVYKEGGKNGRKELKSLIPELQGFSKNSKESKFADILLDHPELFDDSLAVTPESAGEIIEQAEELKKAAAGRKSVKEGKSDDKVAREAARLALTVCGPILEAALKESMSAFTSFINETLREYALKKEGRASLDYDDLEEKARDLLRRSPTALEAGRRKFYRLLIDEFQDTNDLQREILTLLAPPGEGRLFVVGDVKQSIYGFRGANVEVFEKVAGQIAAAGGKQFALRESWRSTPRLVEFTNRLFSWLMSYAGAKESEGYKFIYDKKTDMLNAVRSGEGVGTAVEWLESGDDKNKAEENRQLEADAIARYMKQMAESGTVTVEDEDSGGLRPARYRDMAILLRTFTSHEIYESALRRAAVPYQVVKGRGFYDSQEIKDLANMLAYLDYSADTLAFVSVLRSPIAGLSDPALLALCVDDEGAKRNPVLLADKGAAIPESLSAQDAERFSAFKERVSRWRKVRDRVMISELIEMILSETGYGAVMMSRFNGEQYLGNIFKLIELARTFESDGSRGLKNFISRLKVMLALEPGEAKADITGGAENVVQIMTVHQSKGLEFRILFMADLGSSRGSWSGRMAFNTGTGLGLQYYDLQKGKWLKGPLFLKTRSLEKTAEQEELKRLLYVGMTRARDRLVLSGNGKSDWRQWVDKAAQEAGVELAKVTLSDDTITTPIKETDPPLVERILGGYTPEAKIEEAKTKTEADIPFLRISVTAMAAFSQCPRLYYYRHVMESPSMARLTKAFEKEKGKTIYGADLGTRVHEILETARIGKGSPGGAVEAAILKGLSDFPKNIRDEARVSVKRAFQTTPLNQLGRVAPEAIMREEALAHKIVENDIELIIHGAADIIWFDQEKWSIADYKYSKRPDDERSYLFQLKMYAYAMMTAHDMEYLDTAVVYLREEKKIASTMRFLPIDAPELRSAALTIARRLFSLEKTPENEWPMRERKYCEGHECFFRSRCHGD